MQNSILAIDPGTRCGWAFIEKRFLRPESGTELFELARGQSVGIRFLKFRTWLQEFCDRFCPTLIVYEQAHLRGGYAADLIVGMTTRIQEIAAEQEIECMSVHTATLKKHATGSGKASKEQMIEAAIKRWAVRPSDDNEADALCLLAYALDKVGIE